MGHKVRYFLYGTVFITGASVLIIEVVAVRMLAPQFGSSLYVLSSVLTIILAALSVGYYIGGNLADRNPHYEPLYSTIALSGVAVIALEFFALLILPYGSAFFSIVTGPLILGSVLFFLPAFMLGIVSPYVIKLLTRRTREDEIGAVVGATFFWGTIGSITGSLLTGFFSCHSLG